MVKESDNSGSSTVEKTVKLLLALSKEQHEIGTTELARKLGLHKATVSRILVKLAEYGFVYKNKETRKYWLGPAIYRLGMTLTDVNFKQVLQVARPHVDLLRDKVQETVTLEIWLGNSTVTTYSALSDHPLKVIPPGALLAPHAAAGAKAILSCTNSARVDALLQGELEQITPNTITDPDQLKIKLEEYFKQGYAVDDQEMHIGIYAISAPFFDQLKQPMGAITILLPSSRSKERLNTDNIAKLKSTSALISRELAANHVRSSY